METSELLKLVLIYIFMSSKGTTELFSNILSDTTTPWVPLISYDIWKFCCKLYGKEGEPTSKSHGPPDSKCCLKKVYKYMPL